MRSSYDLFSNLPTTVVLPKSVAHISECFASWYSSSADAGLKPPAQVSSVPGLLFCNRLWPLTSPEGPGIWVSHWYKRTRRIIWTACHLASAWMVLMCLNFSTSRGAAEGQTTKSLFERIKRLKKQKTKQLICEGFSQGGKKTWMTAFLMIDFFGQGCDDQQLEVTVCPSFHPLPLNQPSQSACQWNENHESIIFISSHC